MTSRIEIIPTVLDARAASKKKQFAEITMKIKNTWLFDVYTIDKSFSESQLEKVSSILSNPLTQKAFIHSSKKNNVNQFEKFSFAIEIGFLPGVTDNVATTAKECIEDLLKTKFSDSEAVYASQVFLLEGEITEREAVQIAESLYNPLIQRMQIKSYAQYKKDSGMDIIIPKVTLQKTPQVTEINLNTTDEKLEEIGNFGIPNSDGTTRGPLALDLTFMKTIQQYFKKLGRNPTDIELESIAQTWSEHCKHTIFADPMDEIKDGLYKTYIKGATEEIRKSREAGSRSGRKKSIGDFCVSVFTDNSGGISFDKDYIVTHKVETHNSPSSLDPFGGAITGIVGVNRDALGFGLGAKPVANFYGFCFADPRVDIPLYRDKKLAQKMLSSRRIMEGVIGGVNAGGNQSGIPTPQGFIYFDERYRGKPLVFVGTVGLIPKKIKNKLSHLKKAKPGDCIVMLGGRVGKDGIHGATFSSVALTSGSPATAVQIGDPITQKKLSDAIVKEARALLLYNSITDNGAGGLSCSVAEMAKESGGCNVELEKVPLKYPGLNPWEIWISESQERMTLAVPTKNWGKFSEIMKRHDVEATVIGKFTESGNCVVTYKNKKIMDLPLNFLHEGLPKRTMETKPMLTKNKIFKQVTQKNVSKTFTEMLTRLNITSYAFISQQYDHMVQGGLVLPPLQGRGRVNADTSVFKPLLDSKKGVILSQALYPTYTEIDPYNMAACSIDTAIRNAVASGANPDYLSLLDNFCWCGGNEPERLSQLKLAVKACYDYAVLYGTPFISGKDSMFNDFKGFDKSGKPIKISILPTLLISSFGVIDDATKTVSLDAKKPGDIVYLLGETTDELGGSEYFSMIDAISNAIPKVNAEKNKKVYDAFYKSVQKNIVASSISVGRGGLAVSLAKKSIGGMFGISVDLKNIPGSQTRDDFALFSESQGRILATVAPENKSAFEKIMKGNAIAEIGKITKEPMIKIKGLNGKEIINFELNNALKSYRETFKDY